MEILLNLQDVFKVLLGFFFALLVFNYQEEKRDKRESKKILRIFFREIRLNVISCGNMIKSEKFKPFDTHALQKVKYNPFLDVQENLAQYMILVDHVNFDIMDYLNFQRFFTSDTRNRNQDNERGLHAKRARVVESLKNFQETLVVVRDDVATQIDGLKILKKNKKSINQSL